MSREEFVVEGLSLCVEEIIYKSIAWKLASKKESGPYSDTVQYVTYKAP